MGAYIYGLVILIVMGIDFTKKYNVLAKINLIYFLIAFVLYILDIKFLIIIIFSYYIALVLNRNLDINNITKFIVIFSLLISIFQIAGVHEIFHYFNSHISEGYLLDDILFNYDLTEYKSQQVRPPGMLHSSALLAQVYCFYITIIILEKRENKFEYFILPFLVVFSGSKLVLAYLFVSIILIFQRNIHSLIYKIFPIIFGFGIASFLHTIFFGNLLYKQFELLNILQAIDFRRQQYLNDNFDTKYLLYGMLFFILVGAFLYKNEKERDVIILIILLLLLTQIANFTLTTPIIAVIYFSLIINSDLKRSNKGILLTISFIFATIFSIIWHYYPQV